MPRIGKESITNFLFIFTIVLETLAGMFLFLIWSTLTPNIQIVYHTLQRPLLWGAFFLLSVIFCMGFVIIFSYLKAFLPQNWKVFLSSFFTILVLSLLEIINRFEELDFPKISSLSLISFFIVLVLVIYLGNLSHKQDLLRMNSHKRILNKLRERARDNTELKPLLDQAFESWELMIRKETFRRWGLAESIFLSLIVVIGFWMTLTLTTLYTIFLFQIEGIAILFLFLFLVLLGLFDVFKENRW